VGGLKMSMPNDCVASCCIPQPTRSSCNWSCYCRGVCIGAACSISTAPDVRGSPPSADVARATNFCCFSVAPSLPCFRRAFRSMRYVMLAKPLSHNSRTLASRAKPRALDNWSEV